jgi:hypothetical protein
MSSDTITFIPNYGYVPFPFFQWVVFGVQIALIVYHKQVNTFMNEYFDESYAQQTMKKIILSLPLISIAYYDIFYSSFSLKNLGLRPEYNDPLNQILWIFGSYAVIHILSQDAGLKLGIDQQDTFKSHALFILASFGMAYSITRNRSHSLIALILYYHMKYVISDNITDGANDRA